MTTLREECPFCGTEINPGKTVCRGCGAEKVEVKTKLFSRVSSISVIICVCVAIIIGMNAGWTSGGIWILAIAIALLVGGVVTEIICKGKKTEYKWLRTTLKA